MNENDLTLSQVNEIIERIRACEKTHGIKVLYLIVETLCQDEETRRVIKNQIERLK